MEALIFIVRSLLGLLTIVFLLRVLLPLVRADSRNQLLQAVIRMTNPLVLPLRRLLPPVGKIDTASIIALLIVQFATTAILWMLGAYPWVVTLPAFIREALFGLLLLILQFYIFLIWLYIILSWIAPGAYSPGAALISTLVEPLIRPVRRIVPPLGGLDFSAFFVVIGLHALYILVRS